MISFGVGFYIDVFGHLKSKRPFLGGFLRICLRFLGFSKRFVCSFVGF